MFDFSLHRESAIIFENEYLNFNDIRTRIDHAIALFQDKEIPAKKPIAVAMERSPHLLITMLAALECGIPFFPVDLALPADRIEYMLSDSGVHTVIKDPVNDYASSSFLLRSGDDPVIRSGAGDIHDIAYILYTSGTTGNPKGIEITRKGLFHFFESISQAINFSTKKRIACLTTVSFDIFFLESILPLYKGMTVVLANENEQRNPRSIAELIEKNDVDMIQLTPSRMRQLLNQDQELSCLKNVTDILIGGEAFPQSLLHTLQEKTKANIFNLYGPTEATIWASVSDLTCKNEADIGTPLKNTEIHILNEDLNDVWGGNRGEICISGDSLAKGYINNDKLTAEKFVFTKIKGRTARVYRTGDLGRRMPDGCYEYLGRIDNQIKIRGYRVEPEEIEACMEQFPGITRVLAAALPVNEGALNNSSEMILEAFYTSEGDIDEDELNEYLKDKLPSYMIPSRYCRVNEFAYTPNGKIDRQKVREPTKQKFPGELIKGLSGLSMVKKKAFEIITADVNEKYRDKITLETDMLAAGIDSIIIIKIIVSLEEEFNIKFDDEMLLSAASSDIQAILDYVEEKAR